MHTMSIHDTIWGTEVRKEDNIDRVRQDTLTLSYGL